MVLKLQEKLIFFYIYIGILLVNILGIDGFEYYTQKPTFFKSCQIYKPEFTKCSTELTQDLLIRIVKGEFPEITEKLGSLNPMKLERIVFKPDSNPSVTLEAILNDVYVYGFSDMIIKESRVSKKDFSWLTTILVPKGHLNGKYNMTGKILLLPISGAGNFSIDIENLSIIMHAKTRLYEKGDLTFYNVTEVRVELDMTGMHSNFENLFNGQKEIEESTNKFFNENWRDLFEALRPIVTETVEKILLKLLKGCFDVLPASFLIEDIPTSTELYSKNN